MREGGGNCLKYLKRGWNGKEGKGNKDFEKGGGKLGQGVGALKRGGGWKHLTNYGSWTQNFFEHFSLIIFLVKTAIFMG